MEKNLRLELLKILTVRDQTCEMYIVLRSNLNVKAHHLIVFNSIFFTDKESGFLSYSMAPPSRQH